MRMTWTHIKARYNYERSFTLAERWDRRKEKICIFWARRLPKRLIQWVIICRHADVTSKTNRHPETITAFDLVKDL